MSENENCVRCGGIVAPDGRCWDCGHAQPAFRSHVEVTAPDGAAGVSDRGGRRGVNADAMALTRRGGWTIGVVCDGVSMSPRAERAAQVAAEVGARVLAARLPAGVLPETALGEAAARAAQAVAALATPADTEVSPACTFVAGVAGPEGIWSASIGDSRAYWLPDEGTGMTLTEDDIGEHDALAAWLGAEAEDTEARIRSYRPSVPGRLLLCTDGLWRYLPDAEGLRDAVIRVPQASTDGVDLLPHAQELVRYALDAGGHDNITAVLIPVDATAPPDRAAPETPAPGGPAA
ncbi:PP2C family protein-serine/threonine phosphatase [Streptomyces pristinaespiralis]|uniref:Protein serine/threonine phosphatase PrpC, regulation of stationary phase n=1 Tax=Streptomyces pristinaespiralis TaxID=38300 RepID=A0A0M5IPY9_STRPR|nr:protein phosphatase 2C domain-containing protein [Streptomyces pristinaespiralis]ALC19511.1 Protein serine/threonine phosphatase PrpC, regulation of stationary phase [Streptomyces pristinaespiralis]QMU17469.1 protein phosphatase 2C domain-containing protein [Streptomyces pristinaespiralis]